MMKRRIFVLGMMAVVVVIFAGCGATDSSRKQPATDLSWWPTKAVPQSVKASDAEGEYWWPTHPGEESARIWGNRGYVYVLRHDGKEAGAGEAVELPKAVKRVEQLKLRDIHFHYDKADLTPAAKELLAQAVEILKEHSELTITLEGHTCSCARETYNMSLGLRRAEAVKVFLVGNGIDEIIISAVTYGETRPLIEAEDVPKCILLPQDSQIRKNHALNRRVEFRLE